MAGQIIPLFSRRTFDFSKLQGSQTIPVPIVKAVDVSQYTQATLEVRVHSMTISGGSAYIRVKLYTTAPSAEDPGRDFVYGSAVATTSNLSSSNTAPTLLVAQVSSGFGGMLAVAVEGEQPGSPVVSLTADLSAQLVVKS